MSSLTESPTYLPPSLPPFTYSSNPIHPNAAPSIPAISATSHPNPTIPAIPTIPPSNPHIHPNSSRTLPIPSTITPLPPQQHSHNPHSPPIPNEPSRSSVIYQTITKKNEKAQGREGSLSQYLEGFVARLVAEVVAHGRGGVLLGGQVVGGG